MQLLKFFMIKIGPLVSDRVSNTVSFLLHFLFSGSHSQILVVLAVVFKCPLALFLLLKIHGSLPEAASSDIPYLAEP